jgi:tripartite ATP-independent transporter DctP family solute receptor
MKKMVLCLLCVSIAGAGIVFAGGKPDAGGAAQNVIELRYGNSYAPDHPTNVASRRFAEIVAEKTDGKVKIALFPGGQLGTDRAQAEGTIMGTQDMVLIGTGGISEISPKMGIGECPIIGRDVEHMGKVLDSDVGAELTDELLKKRGLRVLSFWYYGSRMLTSNRPIRSPADMKGFKLRTPQVPVMVAMGRSWGAEPTPMDLSELYLSLQTNVVDGQENPVPTIAGNKFNEVQKYLMLTRHVMTPSVLIISERVFSRLDPAYQKVIVDAAREAKLLNDRLTQEAESPELIKKLGMEVVEPDVEAFRKATEVVPPQFEAVWGKGLYERIVNTR